MDEKQSWAPRQYLSSNSLFYKISQSKEMVSVVDAVAGGKLEYGVNMESDKVLQVKHIP